MMELRTAVGPNEQLSIRRQCELLGIHRSGVYYEPAQESLENLMVMRHIDELYMAHPFLGSRRMVVWLGERGLVVNRKRVQRLMRLMGIEALYPKPKTTCRDKAHEVYPYLLRDLAIVRPNQVWSADITYIRLARGFVYLVAVIDWFSRFVLSWRLSNTLDSSFCLDALDDALTMQKPDIFNTDQGCQFTSKDFTQKLKDGGIQISMDGKGRALDNVFIERLWRSVKYEDVYLHDYGTVPEVTDGLDRYFNFYNYHRFHQSLANRTPAEAYYGSSN